MLKRCFKMLFEINKIFKSYKKFVFYIDFDGVICHSLEEPLFSSFYACNLGKPSLKIIKIYNQRKKNISSVDDLYDFIKDIKKINIDKKKFVEKLFRYRFSNKNKKSYIKNFKPTFLYYLLKIIFVKFKIYILTSRDAATVKSFLDLYSKEKLPVISSTSRGQSKQKILLENLNKKINIIFLDDMKHNFRGLEQYNIRCIHIRSNKIFFINYFLNIYAICSILIYILKLSVFDE